MILHGNCKPRVGAFVYATLMLEIGGANAPFWAKDIICSETIVEFDADNTSEAKSVMHWLSVQRVANGINCGGERDQIRFFAKRLTCSCLKERYARAKSEPKIGPCHHCMQVKKGASLRVCDGCRIAQYCAVGCQRADWLEHKKICDFVCATDMTQDVETS